MILHNPAMIGRQRRKLWYHGNAALLGAAARRAALFARLPRREDHRSHGPRPALAR